MPREDQDRAQRNGTPNGREAVSLLSHDLRSLMFDVTGGLRLLNRDTLSKADKGQLVRVEQAALSLGRMLEQMLDRIDALPAGDGNAQWFSLTEFLDSLTARWAGRAASTGAGFEVSTGKNLPDMIGIDRIALERILANLIGNALKFDPDGSICLSVVMGDDDNLIFAVADCGPGFSQAALTTLYEFHGRPVNASKPGSGLGLHIAQRQALEIGSTLIARNATDGGAVVELHLPAAAWRDGDGANASALTKPEIPDLAGVHVLLAEDNATNQMVAQQMLDSMGCEVTIAADGLEALAALGTTQFDVVLLDIEMPRMSGLAVLKQIRSSDGPNRHTPMIALTAYVMSEHRERIVQAGAADIVAKPVTSVSVLGNTIAKYVRRPGHDPAHGTQPCSNWDFDQDVLNRLLDAVGDGRRAELLTRLDEDLATISDGLEQADATGDADVWRAHSHVLISVAGMTGANGLEALARDLNAVANSKDAEGASDLSKRCALGVRHLRESLVTVRNG